MFKVLYAPFDGRVKTEIDRFTSKPHSTLIWQSEKRVKVLTANIATMPETRAKLDSRMATTCECLNVWTSSELVREMLRSTYYTNEMGAEIRAEEQRRHLRPRPFFPSFSGHGGTGEDEAW